MTKRTMTPEELEWNANREARRQFTLRLLNDRWREVESSESRPAPSRARLRFFPWRIRIERLG